MLRVACVGDTARRGCSPSVGHEIAHSPGVYKIVHDHTALCCQSTGCLKNGTHVPQVLWGDLGQHSGAFGVAVLGTYERDG